MHPVGILRANRLDDSRPSVKFKSDTAISLKLASEFLSRNMTPMIIRYTCGECGADMKIKAELAGTEGKCPKCKTKFLVPQPEAASETEAAEEVLEKKAATAAKAAPPAAAPPSPEKPAAKAPPEPVKEKPAKKPAKGDDDFDPADFLMEANDGPIKAPPAASPQLQRAPIPGGPKPIAPPPADSGRPAAPNSAAAAASALMGGAGTSANARDLLTKAAEESRIRSATIPEELTGPKYDFSMLRAQLVEYLPQIAGVIVVIPLAYLLSLWLIGNRVPLPKLADVTGSISVNGQPLGGIKVVLTPVSVEGKSTNGKPITLRSAVGVTESDGTFHVEYLPGVRGAPLGKVKVTLEPVDGSLEVYRRIPPRYLPDSPSAVIAEVMEVGNSDRFTFNLQ